MIMESTGRGACIGLWQSALLERTGCPVGRTRVSAPTCSLFRKVDCALFLVRYVEERKESQRLQRG